ncbi:PAS domain-containing protein [Aureisphaera galaxeae]|uniref:PAS domain-containing protein n=1 Tax=Aureisphaera galaxeae TaxID=1538023 RepID=UPI0023508129|nr:PAS domain-containing protein [Aureisphaera galaxeae]MDC8004996.1 PAS domain-containing protein [Aureisphaera galaxeae]
MKYDLSEMACLDVYLSTLSKEEQEEVKDKIGPSKAMVMPLMSWDIFSEHHYRRLHKAKKATDMKAVEFLAKKHQWKNDLEAILTAHEFEAIVITDDQQKIIWVNDGFSNMTGYPKSFALNKSPKFLQGQGTSPEIRERIKTQLKKDKPFMEVITNYKKDSEAYECEVKIFPLHNNGTTHYLALERKVG